MNLIGDGISGTMLAGELEKIGLDFARFGDGKANTPPVVFLHLFQGRTFHRQKLECEVFEKSIQFWEDLPFAQQWQVLRSVKTGDRLHKSCQTDTVPSDWKPRQVEDGLFTYGPGFTIEALAYKEHLEKQLLTPLRKERVDLVQLPGVRVLATGLEIRKSLATVPWDENPGRTLHAFCQNSPERQPEKLHLQNGLHMGANPNQNGFTLGGRVNSKGEAKDDELLLAQEILEAEVSAQSEWWGVRIANAIDRWPLIGWLDSQTFLFAGFGGRAFFWLPYCVEIAALALQAKDNSPIPMALRADRFTKR